MKDVEIYAIKAAQEERSALLGSALANITQADFAVLKKAVSDEVNTYIANTAKIVEQQKYIPRIFCTHGKSGLARARKFALSLDSAKDTEGLLNLITGLKGGNYNQGSLRTHIAKAFYQIGTDLNAKKNAPGTRFTDKDAYDKEVGIVILSGRHSHWAANADIHVSEFIEHVITALKQMVLPSAPVI